MDTYTHELWYTLFPLFARGDFYFPQVRYVNKNFVNGDGKEVVKKMIKVFFFSSITRLLMTIYQVYINFFFRITVF